jgi:very-short-patch-repair endonuclease
MIAFSTRKDATETNAQPESDTAEHPTGDAMAEVTPPTSDPVREKAINLFQYLAALVELRSKMTRDCQSYESLFWFSDLPKEPGCFTPAWSKEAEASDDTWLRIDKPTKPALPEPPLECQPWIDGGAWTDSSHQPVLSDEIEYPAWAAPNADSEETVENAETPHLQLTDHPQILAAWEAYIENTWIPWCERHLQWERVQKAYRQVFGIYQMQRRRGEQYELVLGVGTLLWRTPSGQVVRRPVITGRANIALDPTTGSILVTPAAEGARFTLEQDMLEVGERPPAVDQETYERQAAQLETPWNRASVFSILKGWAHCLPSADAAFSEELPCPDRATAMPQLVFAPVLMLRRHSGRTLHTAIQKALLQLGQGASIPLGIRQICGDYSKQYPDDSTADSNWQNDIPDEILFPLPTNQEQQDIICRLDGRPGVLVQGPPGTGKSHAIANLISHFLAHGKRVLVTSQTPRALKVLHGKLPAEIRPLCVSLLGNDTGSLRSLEQSVQGILRKANAWNPRSADRETDEVFRQRQACRGELARLHRLQRDSRETETVTHYISGTPYRGTAQSIAHQLETESNDYSWFKDAPPEDVASPLSLQELGELAMLRNECTDEDPNLRQYTLPDLEQMPTARAFTDAVDAYRGAEAVVSQVVQSTRSEVLMRLAEPDLDHLRFLAKRGIALRDNLARHKEPWVGRAINDVMAGNRTAWNQLLEYTDEALARIAEYPIGSDPVQTALPEKIGFSQLLADAKDLIAHLNLGKGLGFWFFRTAVVKRTRYLWSEYRFGGRLCDKSQTLKDLIAYLSRFDILRRIWREWADHCPAPKGDSRQHIAKLKECTVVLKNVLELPQIAADAEKLLLDGEAATHELVGTNWAESLLQDISTAIVLRQKDAARAELDAVTAPCMAAYGLETLHPVAQHFVSAAQTLDVEQYRRSLIALRDIQEQRRKSSRCAELDARLRVVAPVMADDLKDPGLRNDIRQHLDAFERAWAWKQAIQWLDRFSRETSAEHLLAKVGAAEHELAQLTERLVALLAWESCCEQLRNAPATQGALQAWQQLMRRIGKGTSKYVETYRRDARKYMDACRSAIPAWIMPLHRVAETVEMQPGAFDIVIVDEASQTGPEGLILQYLGKQCIIVGDDKQISPEAVGVDNNAVFALRDRYLSEFPFAETMMPTFSLFDQGLVRFGGNRVTLQEHFRCMPEIIRFSNDLCYADTPLIPLRQYPPQRLEPIMVRHVVDGYREGSDENVINRPEAAAVAKAVIDCLNDSRYAGKSMGVICLQGHAQAQLIETMLLEAVGPDPFEQRQLICGDAYSFQGDERDVIFLSMVAASEGDRRMAPLTRENYRQRFNVAASRARDQMWLFHSVRQDDLNRDCMRRQLLDYCYIPAVQVLPKDLSACDSDFERDVAKELIQRSYRVIPQYPSAGKKIDLVVEGTRTRLAIECDGDKWHGADRYEADIARQRILERCGWNFARVRGSAFYGNRQREMARLLEALAVQGVEPVANSEDEIVSRSWIEDVSGQACLESLRDIGTSESAKSLANAGLIDQTDEEAEDLQFATNASHCQTMADPPIPAGELEATVDPTPTSEIGASETPPFAIEVAAATQQTPKVTYTLPATNGVNAAELQVIVEIVACGEKMWLRLSNWGRVNNMLTPRERKFAYNVGDLLRRGDLPSFRQANWAKDILETAKQHGFDTAATD